jgi:hypothetical protein
LPESRVDDFHTGIAQSARDYFGATVVTVEAGLGN